MVRLDVYLEKHHIVWFREGEQDRVMIRPTPGRNITEWFTAIWKWPAVAHMKYNDFPRCFIWKKIGKSWILFAKLRIRRFAAAAGTSLKDNEPQVDFAGGGEIIVGRIYAVSPCKGERYYFLTLLRYTTGGTSFKDMRIVRGDVCATTMVSREVVPAFNGS